MIIKQDFVDLKSPHTVRVITRGGNDARVLPVNLNGAQRACLRAACQLLKRCRFSPRGNFGRLLDHAGKHLIGIGNYLGRFCR
ncbi:hypothetical protein QP392_10150, partial [Bifidobacterium breve]